TSTLPFRTSRGRGSHPRGPTTIRSGRKKAGRQVGSPSVRACVIGLGEFGLAHARAYRENPRVELVALCDIRKRPLREAGRELSVGRHYEDYSEMLEAAKNSIDIVSIDTPDDSHTQIQSAALGINTHDFLDT